MRHVNCPGCGTRLRFPDESIPAGLRCPKCGKVFRLAFAPAAADQDEAYPGWVVKGSLLALALAGIGLFAWVGFRGTSPNPAQPPGLVPTKAPRESFSTEDQQKAVPSLPKPAGVSWVTASYADLVDKAEITQSGKRLGEVLPQVGQRPELKGGVQPFLAPFSSLLVHLLDMHGPALARPCTAVERQFHSGSRQPAWAAILRSGTIRIYFDGQDMARVFLIGEDPQECYQRDYGVVRHALQGLVSGSGRTALSVEIYAYRNDYARQELSLNTTPYVFSANSFPPPQGKRPLDIGGLQAFFDQRGILEGGRLAPAEGLVLFAQKPHQSEATEPAVGIADFAVVYRAVFHAGDNTAFVSLDPHRDPTKVSVNFGGLLEDTQVGAVVLEADKRFKTITSGLDPNSMNDIRRLVRGKIPSFLACAERELCQPMRADEKWESTRFWYYPDSVEVDADLDYSTAAIRKAQFAADAERGREDFKTPEEFERFKANSLSPAIRQNIDHLNVHYQEYAKVFPELRELGSVARLFGVAVWLKRAQAGCADLDALLSVMLPEYRTERQRTQLLASAVLAKAEAETLDAPAVAERCQVTCHTALLGRSISEIFGGWKGCAEYLCYVHGVLPKEFERFKDEAIGLYQERQSYPIAGLVSAPRDLKALVSYLADQVKAELPAAELLKQAIEAGKLDLDILEAQIKRGKVRLDRAVDKTNASAVDAYNSDVRQYNALLARYESLVATVNANIDKHNNLLATTRGRVIVRISGGIELKPEKFTVNVDTTAPGVVRLRARARVIGTIWGAVEDGSLWIRSRSLPEGSAVPSAPSEARWVCQEQGAGGKKYASSAGTYWFAASPGTKQWRDQHTDRDGTTAYRLMDEAGGTLQIATFRGQSLESCVVAARQGADRIVFTKSARRDILAPQSPPAWYRQ